MQSGKTDTWKLFLERTLSLVSRQGTISCIIPSGIVTNEGAKGLRKEVMQKRIRCFLEFENRKKIFDIDERQKFVLLIVDSAPPLEAFEAAFYLHDMDALGKGKEQEKFIQISRQFVHLVSPDSLSIPEVRGQRELEILEKVYRQTSLLSKGVDNGNWTFRFVEEMNRGTSSELFKKDGKGWNFIEGKHFHQFIPDFEKPNFTIRINDGLKWTSGIREYGLLNEEIHNVPRLAYRDVASSTNIRTMIACILPKNTFNSDKAPLVIPKYKDSLVLDASYFRIICYMCGIMNSMTFDFLMRQRVTSSLSFFLLYQTPVPNNVNVPIAKEVIRLSAKLNHIANEEISSRNSDVASHLSIRERLESTAKLDALVAHHYGLTRQEYEYIINTFEGFEEDENLVNLTEVIWDDRLIRKFNGEVRKRVLKYYDEIAAEMKGEKNG
jgi:hypothetical protein